MNNFLSQYVDYFIPMCEYLPEKLKLAQYYSSYLYQEHHRLKFTSESTQPLSNYKDIIILINDLL